MTSADGVSSAQGRVRRVASRRTPPAHRRAGVAQEHGSNTEASASQPATSGTPASRGGARAGRGEASDRRRRETAYGSLRRSGGSARRVAQAGATSALVRGRDGDSTRRTHSRSPSRAAGSTRESRPNRTGRSRIPPASIAAIASAWARPVRDVQVGVRHATGRHVGQSRRTVTERVCPYLRRRVPAAAPRPEQPHRPRYVAAQSRRHQPPPVHQGRVGWQFVQNR